MSWKEYGKDVDPKKEYPPIDWRRLRLAVVVCATILVLATISFT